MQHWKKLKPRERAAVLALPVTKEFIAAVLATCEQANCIGIANIAWAQGVMQIKEPRLMPEVDCCFVLHCSSTICAGRHS